MALSHSERLISALVSALILGGLVAMLVIGLAPTSVPARLRSTLIAMAVPAPRPVPEAPRPSPRPRPGAQSGGVSAPTRADDAAAAPPASLIVIVPVPAPTGRGAAGVAEEGGGGSGAGAGSGSGMGNDTGVGVGIVGGADGAPAVHAVQTRGHLSPGDVPDGTLAAGASAAVKVRYAVGIDGRVSGCSVIQGSGVPRVDAVPCPLIERRFRFRPARNRSGDPVAETIVETHTWIEPERRGRATATAAGLSPPSGAP